MSYNKPLVFFIVFQLQKSRLCSLALIYKLHSVVIILFTLRKIVLPGSLLLALHYALSSRRKRGSSAEPVSALIGGFINESVSKRQIILFVSRVSIRKQPLFRIHVNIIRARHTSITLIAIYRWRSLGRKRSLFRVWARILQLVAEIIFCKW